MKNIFFGLIATILVSSFSFAQNKVTLESSVSMDEYKSSDKSLQRMADLLNSGFGSLKGLTLNENSNSNYEAIVMFSFDANTKTSNSLILAPKEAQTNFTSRGSCKACGISSGISCYKKIKAFMAANNLTEIDLHVSIGNDGCGNVTW